MATRAPLTWTEIDTDNLSKSLAKLYADMQAAKAHFEAAMTDALRAKHIVPEDKSALYTYRRGLAFAVVEKRNGTGNGNKLHI